MTKFNKKYLGTTNKLLIIYLVTWIIKHNGKVSIQIVIYILKIIIYYINVI